MQNALPVKAVAPGQTITVTTHAPANAAYGGNFTVSASADSGLDVSYTAIGACSNVGAVFTINSGSGTCTVQYDQAGDGTYNPAPQVTEDVTATCLFPDHPTIPARSGDAEYKGLPSPEHHTL